MNAQLKAEIKRIEDARAAEAPEAEKLEQEVAELSEAGQRTFGETALSSWGSWAEEVVTADPPWGLMKAPPPPPPPGFHHHKVFFFIV